MKTKTGRLIPMIAAIGNHEVVGAYDQSPIQAPFFYSLFDHWSTSFGGAYGTLDFADYLSIVLLDSDHTCRIEDQTNWLRGALKERSNFTHVFVAYHVPAYPSVRNFTNRINTQIRSEWLPAIEESGQVRVVFEHHDHAFKRTKPLLKGEPNKNGVVYLGDGSWGRGGRPLRQDGDLSMFERREAKYSAWKVTLSERGQEFWAGDETNTEIDSWSNLIDVREKV